MPLPANSISIHTFSPQVGIIIDIIPDDNLTAIFTQSPHTFIEGQSVKIIIPPATRATTQAPAFDFGMHEINGLIGTILVITTVPTYGFLVDIDSRSFEPFNLPASYTQYAQAVPVGERNSQLNGAWRNILGPRSPFGGENAPT